MRQSAARTEDAKGGTAPDTAPEILRRALAEIEDGSGRLTPDVVLAHAQAPTHPLHDRFEWDNEKASHQYRIEQARALIRSVQVVITIDHHTISPSYYVRDPRMEHDEPGYVSLDQLRTKPDIARSMIDAEFARVLSLLKRAEDLAEALGLAPVVKDIAARVKRVRTRAQQKK